ncbi:MAG: hypothetical protein ACLR5G_03875 [Eubacteriales bacterium]
MGPRAEPPHDRRNPIEETYEVVEAIDKDDMTLMQESSATSASGRSRRIAEEDGV